MTATSVRDTADDTGVTPDRESTTGTRRWHKIVGIIGLVVALWVGSEMYDVIVTDFGADPGHGGGETSVEEPEVNTGDGGGDDPSQGEHG